MRNVRKLRIIIFTFLLMIFSISPNFTTEAKETETSRIVVSMGDSFSSGEGIEPFYDQNLPVEQKVESQDWLAHRSEKSWGGQLTLPGVEGTMADHKGTHWFFTAVSGAETKHITKEGQSKEVDLLENSVRYKGKIDLKQQLTVFEEMGAKKADYVTLTLGGNDAKFTEVVKKAVVSTAYLDISGLVNQLQTALDDFDKPGGIRSDLKQVYKEIENAAGSQAQIIVAGYPQLLSPIGTNSQIITAYEAGLLNSAVSELNKKISDLVLECKNEEMSIHFVSVEEEFEGHGAYSLKPYINGVILGSQSQELKDFTLGLFSLVSQPQSLEEKLENIQPASAYSFHPNEEGAKAYARCVQAKIDELEKVEGSSGNPLKFAMNMEVSVLDEKGNFYEDCVIRIEGEKDRLLKFEQKISKVYEGSDSSVPIHLEKGIYTVIVNDKQDESKSYSKVIEVDKDYKQSRLIFDTDFGYAQKGTLIVPITEDDTLEDDTADLQEHIPTGAVEFNGHYYYVYEVDFVNSQAEATEYCKNQGGHLATITSQEENDFLYSYIAQEGYASAYFGLSDTVSEGDWIWNSGEEVTYTNWHSGEPNSENPNEDYVMFYYKYLDGTWNDGDFGGKTVKGGKAFICEWGESTEYQEIKNENWKEAYLTYIEEQRSEGSVMTDEWNYKLVHVDGDGIPELYINFQSTAGGDVLCSFQNGILIEQSMWNYGFSYIEGKNLFRDYGGHMDWYYDSIYSIVDGEFVLLAKGEFGAEDNSNVQYDVQGFPIYEYCWNGESVASELLYEQLLHDNYAIDQETRPYDGTIWDENAGRYVGNGICDYNEIIEIIDNYETMP